MATNPNPYGRGIAGISDWPKIFVFIGGQQILGQDLAHRLQTPRGSLAWDPDAGWDVRLLLRGALTQVQIHAAQGAISAECEKDERVNAAAVELTFIAAAGTLIITITITGAAGPFILVLSVDALTVAVLKVVPQ